MCLLQIKEEGQRRTVLQNFLLDRGKIERMALVQVGNLFLAL